MGKNLLKTLVAIVGAVTSAIAPTTLAQESEVEAPRQEITHTVQLTNDELAREFSQWPDEILKIVRQDYIQESTGKVNVQFLHPLEVPSLSLDETVPPTFNLLSGYYAEKDILTFPTFIDEAEKQGFVRAEMHEVVALTLLDDVAPLRSVFFQDGYAGPTLAEAKEYAKAFVANHPGLQTRKKRQELEARFGALVRKYWTARGFLQTQGKKFGDQYTAAKKNLEMLQQLPDDIAAQHRDVINRMGGTYQDVLPRIEFEGEHIEELITPLLNVLPERSEEDAANLSDKDMTSWLAQYDEFIANASPTLQFLMENNAVLKDANNECRELRTRINEVRGSPERIRKLRIESTSYGRGVKFLTRNREILPATVWSVLYVYASQKQMDAEEEMIRADMARLEAMTSRTMSGMDDLFSSFGETLNIHSLESANLGASFALSSARIGYVDGDTILSRQLESLVTVYLGGTTAEQYNLGDNNGQLLDFFGSMHVNGAPLFAFQVARYKVGLARVASGEDPAVVQEDLRYASRIIFDGTKVVNPSRIEFTGSVPFLTIDDLREK